MFLNIFKIRENKNKIQALSLVAIFAISILMAFAQPASGQSGVPQPETMTGYISVAPTLIGLGQAPTVNTWVFPLPTTYNYSAYFNGFYGLTVTFTRPDGTKDTFTPTDGTGGYAPGQMQALGALFFTHYVPNMVGNWSVSFTLPAQNITDTSGTVQYAGCTSNTFYFTVQADTVLAGLLNGYPWAELPNSNVYWSYPINDNNREWYQISGDWTGITNTNALVNSPTALRWQPYGTGPSTAHIVWSQPLKPGGLMGGDYGSLNYMMTSSGLLINPAVITQGKVFENIYYGTQGAGTAQTPVGTPFGQFRCFDLTTGKVLYTANGTFSCGIHLPGTIYQQSGTAVAVGETITLLASSYGASMGSYLFGTITVAGVVYWNYYDPLTGALLYQINNAGAARLIDGTVLAFGAQPPTTTTDKTLNGYLYRWNMTSVTANNWNTGITWKVTLPALVSSISPSIFAVSPDLSTVVVGTKNQYWGYNADTGALLWNLTVNYPVSSNQEFQLAQVPDFIIFDPVAATFHCYSETTGAQLWETPSFASSIWATTWTVYYSETNDLNNMYIAFPDGSMRAYSLTTGDLIWTSTPFASTEYPNNAIPMVTPDLVMVGGNIYSYAGYSSSYQLNPVPRFAMLVCINATTGKITWTLNGGFFPTATANGYLMGPSQYDGNMYCLGKGTTSTTVTAPLTAVPSGTAMTIQGSVFDLSPGGSNTAVTAKFPNGLPAISDANMSAWMDYLYMQNATLLNNPPNCIGVPVTLTAVDPNGNSVNIGTTTSDSGGHFATSWTPTTAGLYTVYATFAGSNSYFSSYGETSTTVSIASASTTTPAPTSTASSSVSNSDLVTYLAIATIAIIIAIAIVGALILRKK